MLGMLSYLIIPLIRLGLFNQIWCTEAVAYNDCFVSDYGVRDCGWGTFWSLLTDPDTLETEMVASEVSDFQFNFAMNWTDGGGATVTAEQRISANITDGALHYIYTKLSDRPEYKIISDLSVTVSYMNTVVKLPQCKVANDLSDIDSRKWERCYYMSVSQYYAGLKVYPPEYAIGGQSCESCVTQLVTVNIEYIMEAQVCGVKVKHRSSGGSGGGSSTTSLEGRAYLLYIADWTTPPDVAALQFRWPEGAAPTTVAMSNAPPSSPTRDGYYRFVFSNASQLSTVSYLSWTHMDFHSPCLYGPNAEQEAGSLFVSLFVISVVLCFVMLLLLAWSKHASWKWHGGDFEWDAESRTSSIDDSVAPNVAPTEETGKHRRLSLSTILEEANNKTSAILNPIFKDGDLGMPKGIEMLAVRGERAWSTIEDKSKSVKDSVQSAFDWNTMSKLSQWNAPAGSTRLNDQDDEDDEDEEVENGRRVGDAEARSGGTSGPRRNPRAVWERVAAGEESIVKNPIFSDTSPRGGGNEFKPSY